MKQSVPSPGLFKLGHVSEGPAQRKCSWLSVTEEQHLLASFPQTPTLIPLETLSPQSRPPCPQPPPAILGSCWVRVSPKMERKMPGPTPPPPSSAFQPEVSAGCSAWLPSLDLYLLAAYPQLTPPRLASAAAKGLESFRSRRQRRPPTAHAQQRPVPLHWLCPEPARPHSPP